MSRRKEEGEDVTRCRSCAQCRTCGWLPSGETTCERVIERRSATETDALRCGLERGLDLKHWDPDEQPLRLVGSAFDAQSLGKWVYDWTRVVCDRDPVVVDQSGRFWLLIMFVASRAKLCAERQSSLRGEESEMVGDFATSGLRLMDRLQKLLDMCEVHMERVEPNEMGRRCVITMFCGGDVTKETQELMSSMGLWRKRLEANCGFLEVDAPVR